MKHIKIIFFLALSISAALWVKQFFYFTPQSDQLCTELQFSNDKDTAHSVHPFLTKEGYMVIIPSFWDPTKITAKSSIDVGINGVRISDSWGKFAVELNIPYSLDKSFSFSTIGKNKIKFLQSQSNTISIHTRSGSLDYLKESKSNREDGSVLIVNKDGDIEYSGKLVQIHGRGNHTWSLPKKPFSIKIETAKKILGLRKDKNFNLLNNYFDPSFLRSWLALTFEHEIKTPTHPRCDFATVYINGRYQGLYLITNKIEVSKRSIDITDLDDENDIINEQEIKEFPRILEKEQGKDIFKAFKANRNPDDITGGYLFEINYRYACYEDDMSGGKTNSNLYLTLRTPKYATKEEVNYILNYYNEVDSALTSDDGVNPRTGKHYTDYIDVESYVRHYLMNELFFNAHGDISSFKQYKDRDSIDNKIYAAASWDYDKSIGSHGHILAKNPEVLFGLATTQKDTLYNSFICHLEKRPEFYDLAQDVYNKVFANTVSSWLTSQMLDSIYETIRQDVIYDNLLWHPDVQNEEKGFVDIRDFMAKRTCFLQNVFINNAYHKAHHVHLDFNVKDLGHGITYLINHGELFPIEDLSNRSLMGNGAGDLEKIIDLDTNEEFKSDEPITSNKKLMVYLSEMTYWERLKRKIRVTFFQ